MLFNLTRSSKHSHKDQKKKKKNLRSQKNPNLVRKNGLKKYHPENVCNAVLCLPPKPWELITQASYGLKLPCLAIHLTSTMVHFPQNNLSEKDSLGTCDQKLQEKKIRIWPFIVKSTVFNTDCLWRLVEPLLILKENWVPVSILAPTSCGTLASHWASLRLRSPVYINI